ncbi:MAG: hypothetical protein JNN13_08565 [Planctomycetes bacterium]|nr:hypothetical protein [Planctomycetota bacterium]
MNRVTHARLFSLAVLAALTACSSGGDSVGSIKTGGDFIVLQTEPSDNGTLFLNDSINIDFSNDVDLDSVSLSTFAFEVKDQLGNIVSEPVAGGFALGKSPGDAVVGRRLKFTPRLPTNDLYTNGGFRPGRKYTVQLVGGSNLSNTVLRDAKGKSLSVPRTFSFQTADGTSPGQLFRNTAPGGPRRTGLEFTPGFDSNSRVVLNKLGAPPLEVRLKFDQPLSPTSTNVPVAVNIDPATRTTSGRGRVFFEYDDPILGDNIWIPADFELESNSIDGATLVARPLGVLPNNATIRVIVENTLEDISGESNVANSAYNRVFGTFQTKRAYEQQFDGVVEDFLDASQIDFQASFTEPMADVGPGYIKAGFAFEGTTTGAEFEPTAPETILNTDFTQVVPKNGAPYNVSGGVFNFKNVTINTGKVVKGQGSNPMVWLCAGTFTVNGKLQVNGGDGERIMTSANASLPKAGGAGVCGGGDGGNGSPSSTQRSIAGGTGNGPLQVAGGGGAGGTLSCTAGCNRGSGGGGGSLATQGDPNYKQKTVAAGGPTNNVFPIFQQQTGTGGNGCTGIGGANTRQLQGGAPGPIVFVDARTDNNFWGVGIRMDRSERVTGELSVPVGGGGGGGGGDLSYNSDCATNVTNFEADSSGGGGGGGGGVLIVKALGPIIIGDQGYITANGGDGGGGEQSASCSRGGGGGGGAGGMVILMSATGIEITAKGSGTSYLYGANNNYDFSISADGGICRTGTFQAPIVQSKYPTPNTAIPASFATSYDSAPLGGFGGMGVVQLMAPPGSNGDGTNTVLDDNIKLFKGSTMVSGAEKQALLAWRGFPNQLGQGVNDAGAVITIGDNEGDIRPSPVLLPVPFGAKTRLRSNWIDTGATVRTRVDSSADTPRSIFDPTDTLAGPRFEFGGLNNDPDGALPNIARGYARYTVVQNQGVVTHQTVVPAAAILAMVSDATHLDRPAYRIDLQTAALGSDVDRYSQYNADLLNAAGTVVGSFRILAHTASQAFLEASAALPSTATQLRVTDKFFEIITDGQPGLGSSYLGAGGVRVPNANVRIGFAFHTNPGSPTGTRLPATPGTFLYDITDAAVQEQIRQLHAAFVQWDVTFDTAFKSVSGDIPPTLVPGLPRPELHFLRLPYRF